MFTLPRKHPSLSSLLKILVIASFAGPCSRSSASICSCQNWIRYFFRDAWHGGEYGQNHGKERKAGRERWLKLRTRSMPIVTTRQVGSI